MMMRLGCCSLSGACSAPAFRRCPCHRAGAQCALVCQCHGPARDRGPGRPPGWSCAASATGPGRAWLGRASNASGLKIGSGGRLGRPLRSPGGRLGLSLVGRIGSSRPESQAQPGRDSAAGGAGKRVPKRARPCPRPRCRGPPVPVCSPCPAQPPRPAAIRTALELLAWQVE